MSTDRSRTRALTALLLLVPFPSIGATLAMWIAPGAFGKAVYFLCKVWILALPLLWLIFVEHKPLSLSPLRKGGVGVGVATGAAIGGGILALFWFVLRDSIETAPLHELASRNQFDRAWVFLSFAIYLTLVNALLEEYVWRWFVLTRCEALMPSSVAVIAASVCFTLHHVIALKSYLPWSTTLSASACVLVGGVLWGWMYRRYRSVWPAYVSHVLVDAGVLTVGWLLLFG